MDKKLSSPLSTLQWVDRDMVKPNDYNPNKVSKQNLELLKQSILTNGWTLPIVVRPDFTIIDGFHRWTVAGEEPLKSMLEGKVPVVIVEHKDKAGNIYGTVTHNRARGTHLLEPMKAIVKELILNDGTQLRTDSKKDNEKKRRTARFSALDNTIVRLTILFKTIQRELDSAFGLYDLKRQINRIANLDHKLTVREWKKAVSKTLGIDLLDDYYSGEYYAQMLEKWVSDNVDLIKTVPNQSLERMKELVYESYMKGSTTTNIVREIQRQYGMSKRHAKLIARDQTAKLNADITESQQRDAGVSKYEWSGVMDRRERKSHRELEGKIISWDNPPDVGNGRKCHPGQDYQCRCCAIPVFDIDNLDLPV